ncbi:MAG TPA: hypothetical protein VMU16_05165 [Candidatus Binataceae bacterium]|nr:hypothetical protein [Candidatus Binataceae bacterium]
MKLKRIALGVMAGALTAIVPARNASAIDFYEIQIYSVDTAPPGHLQLELHSNSVTTATGAEAKSEIGPYQIHETLEATYGLTPWLEIGQYLCTAKLDNGNYEYAGARSKVHFGIPMTEKWPVQFGGNIEIDYMRHAAEENPLTLEMRPIAQTSFRGFTLIGNFAFEDPFSGPGAHRGVQFAPSGELEWSLTRWLVPAVEYYGDMGALEAMPGIQRQQHFIVPALNFDLIPQLELNLGVGVGLTTAGNGLFLKSIVGWTF